VQLTLCILITSSPSTFLPYLQNGDIHDAGIEFFACGGLGPRLDRQWRKDLRHRRSYTFVSMQLLGFEKSFFTANQQHVERYSYS
jgi:hypothetical protein